MSKDDIVNKFKKPKLTAADKMYGNEGHQVINETAATNEGSENNINQEDAIAKAFADETQQKREKILKGIYLDSDVLEVYKEASKHQPRGWGSQLVSDLLRKEFIRRGIKIDPQ